MTEADVSALGQTPGQFVGPVAVGLECFAADAIRLAVQSFGERGCSSSWELEARAEMILRWLRGDGPVNANAPAGD